MRTAGLKRQRTFASETVADISVQEEGVDGRRRAKPRNGRAAQIYPEPTSSMFVLRPIIP
jgi:hypothetical protein